MQRRPVATAAVVGGSVLVLLAVLADTIDIGGDAGFGWKQAAMLAVGLAILLLGVGLLAGVIRPGPAAPGEDASAEGPGEGSPPG